MQPMNVGKTGAKAPRMKRIDIAERVGGASRLAALDRERETIMAAGAQVRTLRERRGWSQTELAERCGSDQRQISDIERGELTQGPTLATLARLSHALGIDPAALLLGDAAPVASPSPPEPATVDLVAGLGQRFGNWFTKSGGGFGGNAVFASAAYSLTRVDVAVQRAGGGLEHFVIVGGSDPAAGDQPHVVSMGSAASGPAAPALATFKASISTND